MKLQMRGWLAIASGGLWMAGLMATAQAMTFATNTIAVGRAPYSVAAADVTGDGRPDVICANFSDNTLTVLTNNGSGTLSSNASPAVGIGPICVTVANVNGDGWPDLVSANNPANTLTVLTNSGGAFASNATLTVGFYPAFVTSADLRGSGRPDLICANSAFFYTLSVLTNNGGGVLSSNATLAVGDRPYCVTAADVNGDGKPDLISANHDANTLTVLTNNGGGVLSSNATLAAGSNPYCVVAADINGDGKPDLICANNGDGTLTVLTNNGGGFGVSSTLTVGGFPYSLAAADFNGDGKPDLAVAIAESDPQIGRVLLLTNDGSGLFGSNTTVQVGHQPVSIAAADFNGDGLMDLACANKGDDTLSILMQVPPPAPTLAISAISNNVVLSWSLALADGFVLQTNLDLLTTNWNTFNTAVTTNGGTGSVSVPPSETQLFFRLKK